MWTFYPADITCEAVSGTSKQPTDDEGGEEEVETTGFKLTFMFKENPYFTNTVSVGQSLQLAAAMQALQCNHLHRVGCWQQRDFSCNLDMPCTS